MMLSGGRSSMGVLCAARCGHPCNLLDGCDPGEVRAVTRREEVWRHRLPCPEEPVVDRRGEVLAPVRLARTGRSVRAPNPRLRLPGRAGRYANLLDDIAAERCFERCEAKIEHRPRPFALRRRAELAGQVTVRHVPPERPELKKHPLPLGHLDPQ